MKRAIAAVCVAALAVCGWLQWRTTRYDSVIDEAATRYSLPFHLVKSLIFEESWFEPRAIGKADERGLMQVTPAVGQEYARLKKLEGYSVDLLFDPYWNLEIGCWYLRTSLDKYKDRPDPLPVALARYNAGASRVARWERQGDESNAPPKDPFVEQIGFSSTKQYVENIIRRAKKERNFYWF